MYKTVGTATLRELEIILETALMTATPGTSVRKIAERLYNDEPGLVEQLQRPWITARLEWMLYRKQDRLPGADQTTFPGFPTLPIRMTLKNRERPYLMQGNMKQLEEFRDVLGKVKGRRYRIVERLIRLMAPYSAKRPGITVAEVALAERANSANE